MEQLGLVIKRIIYMMALHRHHGLPFKFTKLDFKDGFWRMAVTNEDAWNFCYVLLSLQPQQSLNEVELVVPNSFHMVWCESPPFLCSGSETAWDLVEKLRLIDLPPHSIENIMMLDINE